MKQYFTYFIKYLLLPLFFHMGVLGAWFLVTLDFSGYRQTIDPEGFDHGVFYLMLTVNAVMLLVFLVYRVFKLKKQANVFIVPGIFWLLILITTSVRFLSKSDYYEPLDKSVWNKSVYKPIKMTRQLIKDSALIGLTKEEVFGLLGKGEFEKKYTYPDEGEDNGVIVYYTEEKQLLFWVSTENKKVVSVSIGPRPVNIFGSGGFLNWRC